MNRKGTMRIILDTNFLVDVVRFKIDIGDISTLVLEKYELCTLDSVLIETERIAAGKSRSALYARVALELIQSRGIKVMKSQGNADKAILKAAGKNDAVATNDMRLRKMLKGRGTKTIYIKSRKHLGID
jgi:rRNA-processing protein FCF1